MMADLAVHRREFLRESEALDGSAVVDPTVHAEVLVTSQKSAAAGEPLRIEDLLEWHERIVGHIVPAVPLALQQLLEPLNQKLESARGKENLVEAVRLLADNFHALLNMRPFGEETGRVARLFAAYVATYLKVPIIIFREGDRAALSRSVHDRLAMRCFIAGKVREAIYDPKGNLLLRKEAYGSADRYPLVEGGAVLFERHDLLDACDLWKKGIED